MCCMVEFLFGLSVLPSVPNFSRAIERVINLLLASRHFSRQLLVLWLLCETRHTSVSRHIWVTRRRNKRVAVTWKSRPAYRIFAVALCQWATDGQFFKQVPRASDERERTFCVCVCFVRCGLRADSLHSKIKCFHINAQCCVPWTYLTVLGTKNKNGFSSGMRFFGPRAAKTDIFPRPKRTTARFERREPFQNSFLSPTLYLSLETRVSERVNIWVCLHFILRIILLLTRGPLCTLYTRRRYSSSDARADWTFPFGCCARVRRKEKLFAAGSRAGKSTFSICGDERASE